MPISYVNGAPPKETALTDARGRVTAPWFSYLVGLQKSNSGVEIGAGGLNVNGEPISGDANFLGNVVFGSGVSFVDEAGARAALGLGSAALHSASDFDLAGSASAAQAAAIAASDPRGAAAAAQAAAIAASDPLGSAAAAQAAAIAASDPSGAAAAVQAASLQKASNLSDLANAGTARNNLGLGTAATQNSSAFDAAGAAAAAQAAAIAASDPLGTATAAVAAIPIASGTQTGLLSSANWTAFNSKQAALGYTPLNPANNLSDVTAATARANLGVPGLAANNTFTVSQTIAAASSISLAITGNLNTGFGGWTLAADGSPFLSGRTYGSTATTVLAGITLANWSLIYHNSGNGILIETVPAVPIVFGTSNTERMRLSGAGRLSIGSTVDNGTDAVQVTGSLIASTQVKTAGLVTGSRTVTAADTATTSDHTIWGNIAGAVTENLPAAPLTGQEMYLVNIGSAVWTISGNGKNIWAAGASSASITLAANASAILKYDGTLWRRIV